MLNEKDNNNINNEPKKSNFIELVRVGEFINEFEGYINTSIAKLNKDYDGIIGNYKQKRKEFEKENKKSCFNFGNEKGVLELQQKEKEIIEDKINDILEKKGENYNIYSKASLREKMKYSFFHFLAMSEIYGVLTSLSGEIKRTIDFKINKQYNTQKTFYDFFNKSIYRDTSQINLNFMSAILSHYFINYFGIKKAYSICIFSIFFIMFISSFYPFKIKDEIEKNSNYENWQLVIICLLYLSIYFFGGIISFIPAQIFEYNETENFRNCFLMLLTLTGAVIIKNSLHFYIFNNINSLCVSLILCSFLFLSFSLIYLHFLLKSKTSTKKDNDNIINTSEKKEDLYYDINGEEDSLEFKNEDLIPISDYNLDENIYTEKDKNGKNNMFQSNNNKLLDYTASFSEGYLKFEFERISVGIKMKDKCEYFYSFFNLKFIILLLINFFSRFQKVKFKTDLKKVFDSEENKTYNLLILNIIFLVNYSITYLFLSLFIFISSKAKKNEFKKNIIYKQEKAIIYLIIIVCTILLCFSYNNMDLTKSNRGNICVYAIAISGNINYLYYAFYSTKKRQFITMSGYFAVSSVILKIIEIIKEPFNEMYWFRIQVISSLFGISLSFIVIFIIEKEYKYLVMKEDYNNEDSKKKKKNVL